MSSTNDLRMAVAELIQASREASKHVAIRPPRDRLKAAIEAVEKELVK